MNKEKIRYKVIYLAFLVSMCAGLVAIAYYAFLQTSIIDVMLGIKITYSGPSGRAIAAAASKNDDINQRVQAFMKTVTYTIEPDQDLANGDIITVHAHWDQEQAENYHLKPVNVTKDFLVSGLPENYESLVWIPRDFVESTMDEAGKYLKSYLKKEEGASLESEQPVYGAFLNANDSSSDRILWVYEVKSGENRLWYMVMIPDINDSGELARARIFAERAYLDAQEQKDMDWKAYLEKLFGNEYKMEEIRVLDQE